MPKMMLTETLRNLLKDRAASLVNPVEHRVAMMACLRQLFDVVAGIVDAAVRPEERELLSKFRCLDRPQYVVVAAGDGAYTGLERDVLQWKDEGSGAFDDRVVLDVALGPHLEVLGGWPSLARVPKSMLSNISLRGTTAYWSSRHDAVVVYTKLGSAAHIAVVAYAEAAKAYEAEKAARLDVYARLIDGTKYFEDLVAEWPEVKDLYDKRLAEKAAALPATLTSRDRLLLEQDLGERQKAGAGE